MIQLQRFTTRIRVALAIHKQLSPTISVNQNAYPPVELRIELVANPDAG